MRIQYFLNDEYKVLSCLCENSIVIQGKQMTRLSQDDIAALVDMSKTKVHGILKALISMGFVEMETSGKYIVSDEARQIYYSITNIKGD